MRPTALLPLRRAEDFFRPKNPTASAGCEPANLGTKGQHATCRPPKPLIFLYVASTVVLSVKLLFQYLSRVCTFKCSVSDIVCWIKHLRRFSHSASRESVGRAKVISEINWNWCDALKMCLLHRNFVMELFNVQDDPCNHFSKRIVGLPWHALYKKVTELV